jgi:hypothetical protein
VTFDSHSKAFSPYKVYPAKPKTVSEREKALGVAEDEVSLKSNQEGGTQALYIEGPKLGGTKRQQLSVHNAFSLWFLDPKSLQPKSMDFVARKHDLASLWVECMRGLVAVNSVSVGEAANHTQGQIMEYVQREVEVEDEEGMIQ